MVGPGTGLAPFRSFILQRLLEQQEEGQAQCGAMHLFFGCRRRDQDFLYGPTLTGWHDDGAITLHTAFSREGPNKVRGGSGVHGTVLLCAPRRHR
jgi:sulfite reductase alpha subunit-like flavoprotein